MKKIKNILYLSILCGSLIGCADYLDVSSPEKTDDVFVTSTVDETFKTISWCYANYRQNCAMGVYSWNDPIGSDIESYPESGSGNNANARLQVELLSITSANGGFNGLYTNIARCSRIAELISQKQEFIDDKAAGRISDWTQLYGEAIGLKAFCYFNLVKHYGDVPYGLENQVVSGGYSLTSRYVILDEVMNMIDEAVNYMYNLGEGGITANRLSKTYLYALKGQAALYAAGYQTIRTDVPGLYGDLTFDYKSEIEYGARYARRTDYDKYYPIAEVAFQNVFDNIGTARLVTVDERGYANNPYQRHFQYQHDLEISPESLFEIGNIQGGSSATNSEYGYAFARPSNGGSSNAAPCKAFGAIRILPTFYYGDFEEDDKRRDVSVSVTGSNGDGNEAMLNFNIGNKLNGGLATNKWDENRMDPPYTTKNRQSGMSWPMMRLADVILMQAEVKAYLKKDGEALSLVNQIRERAFGDTDHNITATGDALKDAIMEERKLEFAGEGIRRWDMIRSGRFLELATAIRAEMKEMVEGIESNGYYQFDNGKQIPAYIYVRKVKLDNPLTYDADINNPALYPGWRGQYDYSSTPVANKVVGTEHNLEIIGLFRYIDPESEEAKQLISNGYQQVNWGIDIVKNKEHYIDTNLLPGVKAGNVPPRYYWPIPLETCTMSKGNVTNGYGYAQQ